jgi:hypothetical protein|nr:MAG TPA: 43 kDa tail protein [Caudoviricetes sp.]
MADTKTDTGAAAGSSSNTKQQEYQVNTLSQPIPITYQMVISNPMTNKTLLVDPVGDVKLTRPLDCAPAKLDFRLAKDPNLDFQEGNKVQFSVNNEVVFAGYVFQKDHDSDDDIRVLAYDQLRYLKNKDCIVYKNKTATELIRQLCDDLHLQTGDLADTGYKIPVRVEQDKTYADMIMRAIQLTFENTPKHPIYYIYDDAGKIVLKSMDQMKTKVYIDKSQMQGYRYTSSIDKDTYNAVKIVREAPGEKGKKLVNTALITDDNHIKEWGYLIYVMRPDKKDVHAMDKAKGIITSKDRKTREIRFRDVIGNTSVRAGSIVYVNMSLGDITINNYMHVTSVTHHFEESLHTMDLDVMYIDKPSTYEVKYNNDAAVIRKIQAAEAVSKRSRGGGRGYAATGTYSQSEQGAYSKMRALGASDGQASGVLGNIRHEDSDYSPYATNGTHTGLFQLDNDDRWKKYEDWCTQNGMDPGCNDNQITYVTTVENGNIFTGDGCPYGKIPDDPSQAADWFNTNIERSGEDSYASGRCASAESVMSDIGSQTIGVETLQYPEIYGGSYGNDGTSPSYDGDYTNDMVHEAFEANAGRVSPYHDEGCVDTTCATASWYNSDMKDAYNAGIVNTDDLVGFLESRGYTLEPFDFEAGAEPGDLLFYPGTAHVVISDGAGGAFGNSSSLDQAMHYDDACNAWHTNEAPAYIIRMHKKT